jgi:hypothetical protein
MNIIILVLFSYSIRDLPSFQSATMKNALNSILILTFVLSQQAQQLVQLTNFMPSWPWQKVKVEFIARIRIVSNPMVYACIEVTSFSSMVLVWEMNFQNV